MPGESPLKQRLAAIFAADVAEYSRLMAADERGTVAALDAARRIFRAQIEANQGRVIDMAGDSVLAVFETATGAVAAGLAVQQKLAAQNSVLADDRMMRFRIGIHLGDVMEKPDGSIYGDGVNIAARLQALADTGAVMVSDAVQAALRGRSPVAWDDRGEHHVKNIPYPIRAYQLRMGDSKQAAPTTASLELPAKPSIAVLPFNNMSADPEQDYFADGVVEAITATLSRIRQFFVIARNSAFLYKGKAVDVQRVSKELGVRYVLEGSVQRAGNRLRITVQLIDATTGTHIWADRFDGSLEDIFDLQDRITEQVAGALQPSIRLAEVERARRKRPQDMGAYDYTMRAMPHVWVLERDAVDRALELLGQALAIDPDYPLALALTAWCHGQRSVYNWADDIEAARRDALAYGDRAAAHGSDDDPLILAVLGAVHTFARNLGTARLMLERAVALDPNLAWAWSRLGWVANYSGNPERALECFERALRLSPLDPMNFNNYVGIGSAHDISGRYEEALTFYRRALHERPHILWLHRHTLICLSALGRTEEAASELKLLRSAYPSLTVTQFRKAMAFGKADTDRMAEYLRRAGLPE